MSIDRQWELLFIPVVALAFVVPAVLFIALRRWLSSTFVRLICVVGVVWFARVTFRSIVELPICLAHARAHGDLDYDGVGGNAALFIAGWLEPLLACLAVIALTAVARRFRRTPSNDSHATTGNA